MKKLAKKPTEYTCAFKHCAHESKKVPAEEAMKSGTRYYHKDCLVIRDNMETVKRLYFEHISRTVVPAQLVKTIQQIVIAKGVDSDYLVFATKFAIVNKMTLNSPFGLHYIVDNYKVKQAWQAKKAKEEKQKLQEELQKLNQKDDVSFTLKNQKSEGFDSIFGGGKF